MTVPTRPSPHPYTRMLSGPDLDHAWTVTNGMIAILGEHETLTFPVGATWPGLDALPSDWLDELRPAETVSVSGSLTRKALPSELESGLALVHAQMLRTGSLALRLTRLDRLTSGTLNQSTQAALVGARRESVTKVRTEMGQA
ncbi:hypothetical protein [Deinococcus marmoris]|uniref:Uncharacterized protein n=1 Tax=Deinococcus marmoris TaxID=249408 RepID=A0A1U7P4U5_9DEIO|nr:hypothetical protein [Deinococcus marmoris]OLV20192.1 hypothetical protein BOO71_0000604 [Deinococcus marmoris]